MMEKPSKDLLHVEYVNSMMSGSELAEKWGLPETTVRKWISDGDWAHERRALSKKIAKEANEQQIAKRVKDLAEWNSVDLAIAKDLRAQVRDILDKANRAKAEAAKVGFVVHKDDLISPNDLRTLAAIVETTQRIGRIALGVSDAGKIEQWEEEIGTVESVTVRAVSGRRNDRTDADAE